MKKRSCQDHWWGIRRELSPVLMTQLGSYYSARTQLRRPKQLQANSLAEGHTTLSLKPWSIGSCASQTDSSTQLKTIPQLKYSNWAIPLSKHRSCNYTWQCNIAKLSARVTRNWDNSVTNRIWGRILSTTVLIDGRCRTSSVLQHLLQILVFSAWSQVGITRGE